MVHSDVMGKDKDLNDSSDPDMPVKRKRNISIKTNQSKMGRNLRGGGGSDIRQSDEVDVQEEETYSSHDKIPIKEYAELPIKNPHECPSFGPYVKPDAPSPNYYGVPPYGSTPLEGAPIPSYVPFFGGSIQHYSYASPVSTGIPYRPLFVSGSTPCSKNSTMANGGVDAQKPLTDQYDMGMPIGPRAMGPRMEFFVKDKVPPMWNTLRPGY